MGAIVAVAGRMSDRWAILYGGKPRAPVSQLAEETDSKPVQCEFESHRGHCQPFQSPPHPPGGASGGNAVPLGMMQRTGCQSSPME